MQTSQVKTCKNCNLIHELVEKLDFKLWELSELSWNAKKYNLQVKPSQELVSDLLHYKRILIRRLYNANYPCSAYSIQDIAKKLLGKINTNKKCLCFSQAPEVITTTSTSSTTTTTTTT